MTMLAEKRFWAKVVRQSDAECWLWNAAKDSAGYGMFWFGGKLMHASRFSYLIANGRIDSDQFVCHRCDNPTCVNPAHLFLGSAKKNSEDMVSKGRHVPVRFLGEAHPSCRLTASQVIEIRRLAAEGRLHVDLAKQFGVAPRHIGKIVARLNWKHVA